MKRLVLLRHAKAVRHAPGGDRNRGLEPSGRVAAERVGAWIRDVAGRPDLVLVSDAQRTRETFAAAAKALGSFSPRYEARLYEATAEDILELLRETRPDVDLLLVIGHNPGLAELAVRLALKGERTALLRMRRKFPTAAAALISLEGEWSDLTMSDGVLLDFVTPGSLDAAFEDD
jgi:phosphohistidine phosphatase